MAEKNFKLEIVTPVRVMYNGEVISFSAPGVMGGFQVLYNHAPMLAEFGIGEIKLTESNGQELFFSTSGGYVDILKNHVVVLAETVESGKEIDIDRAERAREKAKQSLAGKVSEEQKSEIKSALDRALNRIRVAEKNR